MVLLDRHPTSPVPQVDASITTYQVQPVQGPITQAHACQLNYHVSSFLVVPTNDSKDWMLLNHSDGFIILRNLRKEPYKHKCKQRATAHKSTSVHEINSDSEFQTAPNSTDHNP